MDRLLAPSEVAKILSVTERALASWRGSGAGPPFVKLGYRTVRYRASDVEAWIEFRDSASGVPQTMSPEGIS